MADSPHDLLRDAVRRRRALLVVGAGVPIGATGRPEASWPRLLAHGLDWCDEHLEGAAGWATPWRMILDQGEPSSMIAVAEEVTRLLRAAGGSAFHNWLEATVGSFRAEEDRDDVLAALAQLAGPPDAIRLPLATTNYDDLLEEATGRHPVTWRDGADRVLAVLEGDEPGILHLHGHWRDPESIVLGLRSYDAITRREGFQHLQRAAATFRSLVFVGCGAGLDDPNLGALLAWLAEHLPGQRHPHFRIASEPEIAELAKRHAADRVQPVACGPDHDSLGPFLRSLVPPPTDPGPAPEPDIAAWLRDLEGRTDHIKIAGIVTHAKGALRPPIEDLYTPLKSRTPIARGGAKAEAAAEEVAGVLGGRLDEGELALPDLLPHHPRLLLVGQPGAGKTTFLRLVACMLARDGLAEPAPGGGTWRELHLGLDPTEPPPVPVLLRVADLADAMRAPDAPSHLNDTRRWLLHLLERTCKDNDLAIPADHWQRLLADGGALLLLDGLDEVDDERLRGRIFDVFRDACRHWSCPIVVASRPLATAELEEIGFAAATVEPFGEREIELFVDRWVEVLHRAGEEPPEPRTAGGRLPEEEAPAPEKGAEADYRRALARAILDRPRVKRLASNPVMLTCLAVVHWNEGQLPEGRSRVYRAVIGWLLKARETLRREAGYDNAFAEQAFARLALGMMGDGAGKRPVFDLEEAVVAIDPVVARRFPKLDAEGRRHEARRWLRFECRVSGIVEELPRSRLRFWHLTFQEYLAARELAWRSDGEDDPDADWWPAVRDHLEDAQWRETVELFPGCLLDEGGTRRVDSLLERVDALCREATPRGSDALARAAGLLGRLLQPLEVLDYHPSPAIAAAYDESLTAAMQVFEPEGAPLLSFEHRLAAAEALGRAGDPRFAAGNDHLLAVPGTGGVKLGRYPVTVEEYHRFVEDGGYDDPEVWSEEGWRERQERSWREPGSWQEQLEHPNRPVVEASWWEAEAYCAWLGRLRGMAGRWRLPAEEEWAVAATAEEGEYPWGSTEPTADLANFDGKVGHPTPVGLYPAGRGPVGHDDLAGNVWEWCADDVSGEGVPEDWKNEMVKRLRGGGWFDSAGDLRSAIRDRHHARHRYVVIGFRVAVSPPSR